MRVHPMRSITAKAFYMVIAVILLSVSTITYFSTESLKQQLYSQMSDSTNIRAESAARRIGNSIDNWVGQVNVFMHGLQSSRASAYQSRMQDFVNSNKDFYAFQILLQTKNGALKPLGSTVNRHTRSSSFEGQNAKAVRRKVNALPKQWVRSYLQSGGKRTVLVESFADQTKLPHLGVAIAFKRNNSVLWAVLTTWQGKLSAALPKNRRGSLRSAVIDESGHILSSGSLKDMVARRSLKANPLARFALTSRTPSGFRSDYADQKGQQWLGAFQKVTRFGVTVLVEQDKAIVDASVNYTVRQAIKIGILVFLIGLLMGYFGATGLTKNLKGVINATNRIAAGDLEARVQPGSKDEIAQLGFSVNQMAQQILDLLKVQVEQARVEKELETARMVQGTFFPRSEVNDGNLAITGFYEPASECGGDWWGHFSSSEPGVEYVFIADAMGHGVPAALVTAMAYSSCMTLKNIIADPDTPKDSPAKILERFNRVLHTAVEGKISMTFFAAVFDTVNGTLTYANAGHNFPVLVPQTADDDRAPKKKLKSQLAISDKPPISLKLMGVPLGMAADSTYEETQIPLRSGDKVFMFTDGLIECESPDGKMWGRKTMIEKILTKADDTAEDMKKTVVDAAFGFFADKPIDDDVTVVVVETKDVGIAAPKMSA